jgi:hypothetical protein
MAALSKARLMTAFRVAVFHLLDRTLGQHIPRRCTVAAFGLMLGGLVIALLMAARVLPIILPLGFLALVLFATGGGLLLTRCGEI